MYQCAKVLWCTDKSILFTVFKEQLSSLFNLEPFTHEKNVIKPRLVPQLMKTDVKKNRKFNSLLTVLLNVAHAQIQLMEAKRQLDTQVTLHQKTKELLNAAELELNTLRLQQGSGEPRHLGSPITPIIRGWHTRTYRQNYVTQQHNARTYLNA